MFYLINLLAVVIYYFIISQIYLGETEKRNKAFAFIVCIHAVLFRALANPYNYPDTEGYAAVFQYLSGSSWQEYLLYGKEWGAGYILLNWIIGHFTKDPQVLFATLSIITIIPVVWVYYKTSNNLLLSMLIFLIYPFMYINGFSVVRQHVAAAISLLAIYYSKNLWKSLPLALLACSFHTSAIIVLPFYVFIRVDVKKIGVIRLAALVVIGITSIGLFGGYIIGFLDNSRYNDVLEEGEDHNIVPVILIGSLLIMMYYNKIKDLITETTHQRLLSYMMYGLVIAIFCMSIGSLGRANIYFIYAIPALITWNSYYSPQNQTANRSYIFLVFFLIFLMRYVGYKPGLYDYSFFWEPVVNIHY